MNSSVMLTYYYDEQSESNNSTNNQTSITENHSDLANLDRAHNPALIHHLYLGLGHVGKASFITSL